ncbi:hypothetical protein ACLB2K_071734 [Fragaria x ananassa]
MCSQAYKGLLQSRNQKAGLGILTGCIGSGRSASLPSMSRTADIFGRSAAYSCTQKKAILMHLRTSSTWFRQHGMIHQEMNQRLAVHFLLPTNSKPIIKSLDHEST